MTLFQLEASAQEPCSSTITGLAVCPPPVAAAPAEARAGVARPGTIASRAAARATARSAGKMMRRAVRLSDIGAPLVGMATRRDSRGPGCHRVRQPASTGRQLTRQHCSPAACWPGWDLPMYCRAGGRMAGQNTLIGRAAERAALGRLLDGVREGESRTLVVRGEPGSGKTALLDDMIGSARDFRVLRAVGVDSEMELPFAALQQLCAALLDRLPRLPGPQRDALRVAFGLSGGGAPDRFLVGLAALSLLSEAAEHRPLLCAIDDAQWLDEVSALTLAFVARRLLAEPIALVFVAREPVKALSGLPEVVIRGLGDDDARLLLAAGIRWPIDERVRETIIAEAHGNPL